MFDLTGEAYWMGPKPKKGKRKQEPLFGDMGASNYDMGPTWTGNSRPVLPKGRSARTVRRRTSTRKSMSYKDVKAGFQKITKGYSGSAKDEYKRKEKKVKGMLEEQKYKKKLKTIKNAERQLRTARRRETTYKAKQGAKKVGGKISGFLKRNKSIYK